MIGRSPENLVQLAFTYVDNFKTIYSWYSGPHSIVLPASFLILHGPLLGRSVVACLQSYVEGEKSDLLRDFDDGELIRLMRENEELRDQFTFFSRRTLDIRAREGLCVDLLGAQNLLLTRERGSWGLKLIDYRIYDLERLPRGSATHSRLSSILARLQSLLDALSIPGS